MIKNFLVNLNKKIILDKEAIWLFAILIVAFFLRFYHLGYRDFWYDEITSFYYAQHPLDNWNPPFYWILLHFWTKLFGASEFSLRFPSLLFSFISVFFVYLLGKRLFDSRVGIYAAIFMAFSPFHIQYAQEARPYSLSLFLSILSTYILFMALTEKRRRFWFVFVLVTAAGFYSNINYYHIFLLIAQALCVFILLESKGVKKLFYFLFPMLSFLPWVPRFIEKFNWIKGGDFWWIRKPNWEILSTTMASFDFRYNAFWSQSQDFISKMVIVLLLILILKTLKQSNEYKNKIMTCFILFLFPIVLIFLVSKTIVPVYLIRGLIIFSPYYYFILALGLTAINRKAVEGALICIIVFFFSAGIFNYYARVDVKKPFKIAAKFIEDNLFKEDVVVYASLAAEPIIFYSKSMDFKRQIYLLLSHRISDEACQFLTTKRIWFIFCPWGQEINLALSDDKNSLMVKKYLDKNFKQEFARSFDNGLEVFRYMR
ncbi:MAG: glycosyltransferase family 39 protein [Candidatus Omnitrophota bacterium]|nr:glycosyltransferase family 39 protein [Candidatus Omnitrophota bacterium]